MGLVGGNVWSSQSHGEKMAKMAKLEEPQCQGLTDEGETGRDVLRMAGMYY